MVRKSTLLFISLLVILVCSSSAEAISLYTPTTDELKFEFEPNFEILGDCDLGVSVGCFCARTNEVTILQTYAKGDLSEYVTLKQDILEFDGSDETLCFSFDVKLPFNLDTPGTNTIRIGVVEADASSESASVAAKVAVESAINIIVPYPDEYVKATLSSAVNQTDINFNLDLKNMGKKDLANIKSTVKIFDYSSNTIKELNFQEISYLSVDEKKSISVALPVSELEGGEYSAKAFVMYEGKESIADTSFIIEREVKLAGVELPTINKNNVSLLLIITCISTIIAILLAIEYVKRLRAK